MTVIFAFLMSISTSMPFPYLLSSAPVRSGLYLSLNRVQFSSGLQCTCLSFACTMWLNNKEKWGYHSFSCNNLTARTKKFQLQVTCLLSKQIGISCLYLANAYHRLLWSFVRKTKACHVTMAVSQGHITPISRGIQPQSDTHFLLMISVLACNILSAHFKTELEACSTFLRSWVKACQEYEQNGASVPCK